MKPTILLLLLTLSSCVTERQRQRICNNCPTNTTINNTVRDCTYQVLKEVKVPVDPDSSLLKLYLKCVNGKVVLDKDIKELGRLINMEYELLDGIMNIKASTFDTATFKAQIYMEIREIVKESLKEVEHRPYDIPDDKLKWYHLLIIGLLWSAFLIFISKR
jgi:hypothetical protein